MIRASKCLAGTLPLFAINGTQTHFTPYIFMATLSENPCFSLTPTPCRSGTMMNTNNQTQNFSVETGKFIINKESL